MVITSVARDDLADGGASGFVACVRELRAALPDVAVEVLIPDFRGSDDPRDAVVDAGPEVFNHNLETVPRLYRRVRPGASYKRSLELLEKAKKRRPEMFTKTGIMLGLGESRQEVSELMKDCRRHSVDIFTAGQYMRPSKQHLPVERYLPPEEFNWVEEQAKALGFARVFVGPLVRSSYHAEEVVGR